MGGDYLKPKAMTREQILDTFGESSRWRNPVRLPFMNDRWPKPQDDRDRAYEKMMSTATEWSRKGRPL
jgi:hypothetical protein